jgi:aspartyl-tRNA(Asn)/glutamyl-tRNA(Gln) amidotransferase subunit B
MRTPAEAGAYLRMLRQVMLYLGVSDCNMEEGSLRCDTNVSIRPRGSDRLETRTEIKNLNSFTNVENALDHEILRQIKVRSSGKEVIQQTLTFDPERGETRVLRGKEEAHDYRYFPEPDLAPLHLDDKWIEGLRTALPELPAARLERFRDALGLSHYHADVLVRDRDLADFFDECVGIHPRPQEIANWVVNAVKEETNERGVPVRETGLSPARLVDLVKAIEGGKVSKQKAREVFKAMLGTQEPVEKVIESLGLGQVSDDALLRTTVEAVIRANPGAVEDVRKGKKNSVNFLMGQVMRETKGQANPGVVTRLIQEIIG